MKKNITIACTIASFALICDSANVGHMLMMFLLAGIIPGTNVMLSGTQMLVIILFLTGMFIYQTVVHPILRKNNIIKLIKLDLSLTN